MVLADQLLCEVSLVMTEDEVVNTPGNARQTSAQCWRVASVSTKV